jgi:hypothetical protein
LVYRIHDRVPQRIEAERTTSIAGLLHTAQQDKRTVLVSDGAGMLRPIPSDGARYALDVDDGLSGQFYVWVFGRGPDGDQNSVWLRATGGEPVAVLLEGDDEWGWKRASKPIRLDEGLSYLTLLPRERGTAINQLVITNDPNYRPTSGRTASDALGQARALVSPEPFAEPQASTSRSSCTRSRWQSYGGRWVAASSRSILWPHAPNPSVTSPSSIPSTSRISSASSPRLVHPKRRSHHPHRPRSQPPLRHPNPPGAPRPRDQCKLQGPTRATSCAPFWYGSFCRRPLCGW